MLRELDSRTNDGITVTLTWDDLTGQTVIFLQDARTNLDAFFEVKPEKARDAFDHPFPYFERCKANAERFISDNYSVKV